MGDKYEATVIYDATWGFNTEADSVEEAIEKVESLAYEHSVSLCHQCAHSIDLGDIIGFIVYHDSNEVANIRYEAEQLVAKNKEIENLRAELDKHKALLDKAYILIPSDGMREIDLLDEISAVLYPNGVGI